MIDRKFDETFNSQIFTCFFGCQCTVSWWISIFLNLFNLCTPFQTLGKNLKLFVALRPLYCEPIITRQSSLYWNLKIKNKKCIFHSCLVLWHFLKKQFAKFSRKYLFIKSAQFPKRCYVFKWLLCQLESPPESLRVGEFSKIG